MNANFSFKMKPAQVPNFIQLEKADNVFEGNTPTIKVKNLTSEQKDWLAAEFRKGLDRVAAEQEAVVTRWVD